MCIDYFPHYKDAYANLFMIHDAGGNKDLAIQVVERFLRLFPDDKVVIDELNRYRETGEFDLPKAFQIPVPK